MTTSWLEETLDRLGRRPVCGYHAHGPAAVEPTALAAMALVGHGRIEAARAGLEWLVSLQSDRGSLGIDEQHPTPCWPTGWAVLAWQAATALGPRGDAQSGSPWSRPAARAVAWLLATKGTAERNNEIMGHDTTLQAWPWVEGTHSWVEPSAISLLALKSSGHAHHPRSREAVRLLVDRMLPSGGWNQGNKIVMGRVLRPQVQATGLALAALAGEAEAADHVRRSLGYLDRALLAPLSPASLSYALMGMAAHGHSPADARQRLAAAASDALGHDAPPYPLALAALAALGAECPYLERRGSIVQQR